MWGMLAGLLANKVAGGSPSTRNQFGDGSSGGALADLLGNLTGGDGGGGGGSGGGSEFYLPTERNVNFRGANTQVPIALSGGEDGRRNAMSGRREAAALSNATDPNEMPTSSGWGDYLLGAAGKALDTLEEYDPSIQDIRIPSSGSVQWAPQPNPGLAGLQRMIEQMSAYGYGRRG